MLHISEPEVKGNHSFGGARCAMTDIIMQICLMTQTIPSCATNAMTFPQHAGSKVSSTQTGSTGVTLAMLTMNTMSQLRTLPTWTWTQHQKIVSLMSKTMKHIQLRALHHSAHGTCHCLAICKILNCKAMLTFAQRRASTWYIKWLTMRTQPQCLHSR